MWLRAVSLASLRPRQEESTWPTWKTRRAPREDADHMPRVAATPTVNKLQLGALIKKFRRDSGMSQEQLGGHIFPRASVRTRQSKLARIEAGELFPHVSELEKMQQVLGITDPELIAKMKFMHEHSSQRGRWGGYRAVFSESFRKYIDLEEDADRIRDIAVGVVPDLLQCEHYIQALLQERGRGDGWLKTVTEARLARAELLHRTDDEAPIVHFVLCESAIRRVYGDRTVAREQIGHLIALSRLPNVTIQVVPFVTKSVGGSGHVLYTFTSMRIPTHTLASSLEFVYVSVPGDRRYLDDKESVEIYDRLFTGAVKVGLDDEDSRRFMNEIRREYR